MNSKKALVVAGIVAGSLLAAPDADATVRKAWCSPTGTFIVDVFPSGTRSVTVRRSDGLLLKLGNIGGAPEDFGNRWHVLGLDDGQTRLMVSNNGSERIDALVVSSSGKRIKVSCRRAQ
jgi:hypothetical protein